MEAFLEDFWKRPLYNNFEGNSESTKDVLKNFQKQNPWKTFKMELLKDFVKKFMEQY